MRLLLDESVPVKFRRSLANHEVQTVVEMGWSGITNGELLTLAAGRLDGVITVDKNLPYQQNLSTLPLSVLVLDSLSNELQALSALVPVLNQALSALAPRTCVLVKATPQSDA